MRVQNAYVVATAGEKRKPIKNDAKVIIVSSTPWYATAPPKPPAKIPSFESLGGFSIMSDSGGSMPSASAGRDDENRN